MGEKHFILYAVCAGCILATYAGFAFPGLSPLQPHTKESAASALKRSTLPQGAAGSGHLNAGAGEQLAAGNPRSSGPQAIRGHDPRKQPTLRNTQDLDNLPVGANKVLDKSLLGQLEIEPTPQHSEQTPAEPKPKPKPSKCHLPGDETPVPIDFFAQPEPRSRPHAEELRLAAQVCPGLAKCADTEQPFLYPVMAHRNRISNLARYVASLAAVGHGFVNTAPIAALKLENSNIADFAWWPLVSRQKYSASRLQMWARCTCIIVGDFNTTFAIDSSSGDHPSAWSFEQHGHLRDVVNRQWPGHVAWVNSPEPFSSALGNVRAWSAIKTDPKHSIVHISVADMLHTSGDIFNYALQVTRANQTGYLPQTWYASKSENDEKLGHACVAADPAMGQRFRDGTGVLFASLFDLHRCGGYSQEFLSRSLWGDEDGNLVCRLQEADLNFLRKKRLGFCHLWHEREFNRTKSLDGK